MVAEIQSENRQSSGSYHELKVNYCINLYFSGSLIIWTLMFWHTVVHDFKFLLWSCKSSCDLVVFVNDFLLLFPSTVIFSLMVETRRERQFSVLFVKGCVVTHITVFLYLYEGRVEGILNPFTKWLLCPTDHHIGSFHIWSYFK